MTDLAEQLRWEAKRLTAYAMSGLEPLEIYMRLPMSDLYRVRSIQVVTCESVGKDLSG